LLIGVKPASGQFETIVLLWKVLYRYMRITLHSETAVWSVWSLPRRAAVLASNRWVSYPGFACQIIFYYLRKILIWDKMTLILSRSKLSLAVHFFGVWYTFQINDILLAKAIHDTWHVPDGVLCSGGVLIRQMYNGIKVLQKVNKFLLAVMI
jgi:hypothetical protein